MYRFRTKEIILVIAALSINNCNATSWTLLFAKFLLNAKTSRVGLM